jgi:peptide chain release factor 1
MLEKLREVEDRFTKLEAFLGSTEALKDMEVYQRTVKEHSDLTPLVQFLRQYQETEGELASTRELLSDKDPEVRELAKAEQQELRERLEKIELELKVLLLPRDPNDAKNIFLEIRAGTGGEEAALFGANLFRMYTKFAESLGWRWEVMSSHSTGVGGFKEIIILVEGKGAYSRFKYESGNHRVQRVPATESQGRIHTSAVTVAVLPEAEEVEVEIKPEEIRVDVFRSSGPGGQSVNTTDSAVRITHLPSGLVVTCQDEKSQHKNKAKALKVLRARVLDQMEREQQSKISETRRSQVGSGDRSERIRTYNFPQSRVTDHRIGLTLYKLDEILDGSLNQVVQPLTTYFQAEALKGGGS